MALPVGRGCGWLPRLRAGRGLCETDGEEPGLGRRGRCTCDKAEGGPRGIGHGGRVWGYPPYTANTPPGAQLRHPPGPWGRSRGRMPRASCRVELSGNGCARPAGGKGGQAAAGRRVLGLSRSDPGSQARLSGAGWSDSDSGRAGREGEEGRRGGVGGWLEVEAEVRVDECGTCHVALFAPMWLVGSRPLLTHAPVAPTRPPYSPLCTALRGLCLVSSSALTWRGWRLRQPRRGGWPRV